MKKSTVFSLMIAIAFLFVLSCGPSLKVTSDFDRSVDFSQFKTFRIASPDLQHQSVSPLNQQRIVTAISNEMGKKGFKESAEADLEINAVVILENRQSVTASTTNFYGTGGFYRPYSWGPTMSTSATTFNVQHYQNGSLIIDILDTKTRNLVWTGVGNRDINRPLNDPDKEINSAVQSIMANFPPGTSRK
jgi:hypothetical protein